MACSTNEINKSPLKLLIKYLLNPALGTVSDEEIWKSGCVIGFSKYVGSSNGRIKKYRT